MNKFMLQPSYVIIAELWFIGLFVLIVLYAPQIVTLLLFGSIGTIYSIVSLAYYFANKTHYN